MAEPSRSFGSGKAEVGVQHEKTEIIEIQNCDIFFYWMGPI